MKRPALMRTSLKRADTLSKRIVTEMGIIVVLSVVLGGIGFFISGFADDFVAEQEELKQEIESLQGQSITVQNKLASMASALPLYKKLVGDKGIPALALDRQDVTRVLEALQPAYHLSNMRLTVAPIQELANAQFIKTKVKGIESELSLNFDAVSDVYAIRFLIHALAELPGVGKVTRINLISTEFSSSVLQGIASGGSAPLVRSDITVKWRGMREVKAPDAPAEPGSAAPPAVGGAPMTAAPVTQ